MNMYLSGFILSAAFLCALNFGLCFCACAYAEYEIGGECCPMCAAGNHVYWHCTEDTSTTCVPCSESTYTDQPNGFLKCFPCSRCDAAKGIRVKKPCTRTADVICEPHEGYYCIEQNEHSCTLGVTHSKCSPGQYIKQTGTAFSDTVCENCLDGTFSNGSLMACQPHSKCYTQGLTEVKAGTTSVDAECGKSNVGHIVGVIVGVLLMTVLMALFIFCILNRKKQGSNRRKNDSVQSSPRHLQDNQRISTPLNTFADTDVCANQIHALSE